MYSEINFIFSPLLDTFGNSASAMNTKDIYGRINTIKPRPVNTDTRTLEMKKSGNSSKFVLTGEQTSQEQDVQDAILVFKHPTSYGSNIVNYLKNSVYHDDDTNEDPYISLLNYFSTPQTKALRLKAADFAYLKDLGVFPINRLWILRRFPDNTIVPNNLMAWGKAVEPISTVVGWFKNKEDSDLLSFNFNEVWTDTSDMIHQVIGNILQNMGIKGAENIMSVPGWSEGLLFGMLKAMGLTQDYNATNVPTGDPNVLRTAKMRDALSGNQGLLSSMSLTLETTYEQKYINGVDPGMAMLDILANLFKMGTSEMKFVLGNSPVLQQLLTATYAPSEKGLDAWTNVVKALVDSFINGITTFIDDMSKSSSAVFGTAGGETTDNKGKDNGEQSKSKVPDKGIFNGMGNAFQNVATALLAGTVYKFRWPLKGSISLMTGINTTPWHLTIGNPYSPIINIGNVYVKNVDVKLSNDLGFNDMPIRIDTSISCDFGRPLGRSELERMFNNGYKRVYAKGALGPSVGGSDNSSVVSQDERTAASRLIDNQGSNGNQPAFSLAQINKSQSANEYLNTNQNVKTG